MESSKILKETVERAKKEVEELLEELRARNLAGTKLETGLKEVQEDLKVLDWHLDRDGK